MIIVVIIVVIIIVVMVIVMIVIVIVLVLGRGAHCVQCRPSDESERSNLAQSAGDSGLRAVRKCAGIRQPSLATARVGGTNHASSLRRSARLEGCGFMLCSLGGRMPTTLKPDRRERRGSAAPAKQGSLVAEAGRAHPCGAPDIKEN